MSTKLDITVWGKVILWKLCKRLKFDRTIKWYMHKLESVQENKMHKILWDFEIQTNHLRSVPVV